MMVIFQDDTQVICDKILFDSFVPLSRIADERFKTLSFRFIMDGEISKERLFTIGDLKEVAPIHCVPLLITIIYHEQVYEFLKHDFTQEEYSKISRGFESFYEANQISYPNKVQYLYNQPDYNSLIHNEVDRSQDNLIFMNNCPKVPHEDDDFIQDKLFTMQYLKAVFKEGVSLHGTMDREKCYLYSIEPLFLDNPETKKDDYLKYYSHEIRNHYHELSGTIDLSKKTIEFKSNTEKWDYYSHRSGEYTFYSDYVTIFERLSTRYLCLQYHERLIEKCNTDSDIHIKSERGLLSIEISITSQSPIDWGKFLSIRVTHHPHSW